jgi:prepilin-type N-terminal cleavage/methylation domain-containing protein
MTTCNKPLATRRGFTLVELLVVVSIIGLLTSIATVSYSSTRMKARDVRRLADLDALRTALEMYSINRGGFPEDRVAGPNGIVLGLPGAIELTDAGWVDADAASAEETYLQRVPANPPGGGVDYFYYSLNRDGTDCNFGPCPTYRIEYTLESSVPGVNLAAGAYIADPILTAPAPPELAVRILAREKTSGVDAATARIIPAFQQALIAAEAARHATIGNPAVQQAAGTVVAPVSTAVSAVSALTGLSSVAITSQAASAATAATAASAASELGALILLLFTQPLMLLRKRKQYAWGVVYDSQKKLPLDLAIVRLVDDATGRAVQTRVTDKAGRIFFFAGKGTYRLEVAKPGFAFPSRVLVGEREDGRFINLYLGQRFSVPESGQVINPAIPLDPVGYDADDKEFVKHFVRSRLRYAISLIGLILTMVAFAVKPTAEVGGLFVLNLLLYYVFRRISYPKPPAEWGMVKDEKTGRPIAHAVIRLFSSPYNKLVETRVTDKHGRYNFLVGQNVYYLTATSRGYWKTESFPLDLRGSDTPQVISASVSLRPISAEPEKRMDANDGKS